MVNNFNFENSIRNLDISKYLGEQEQYYPPYSSIVVNKKPLWLWSKENKLDEIIIPKKKINIYELEYIKDNLNFKNYKELLEIIKNRIYSLSKENYDKFRVKDIIEKWSYLIKNCNNFNPIIKRYRIKCSSGTYVRGLVNKIGGDLGIELVVGDKENKNINIIFFANIYKYGFFSRESLAKKIIHY